MTATSLDLSQIRTDALTSAATFRTLIGVYSSAEVDALIAGITALTAEDIDTLAEINAILTDANLASIAYVDGLASNYATAAQGALADSALQPSDIASGTITARTGAVNLSGGADGDVLTVQADGSLAVETPAGGGGAESPLTLTASGSTETPLTVQGAASQTANLTEWENSSGTVLASITSIGSVVAEAGSYVRPGIQLGSTNYGVGVWSNGLYFRSNGSGVMYANSSDLTLRSGGQYKWSSNGTFPTNTPDAGIARDSAGVVKITNGSTGTGDLKARRLNLASLPTSDPAVAGDVWNDSGTLKISAG